MWQTEHRHETTARPEAVWELWEDVPGWPRWDTSLEETTLAGPFEVGVTGTLRPSGAPEAFPFTVTAITPGVGFADETALGPLVLRFSHQVVASASGSTITVRVEAEGPGAEEVGPAVAADMPESVAALAAAAVARTLRP